MAFRGGGLPELLGVLLEVLCASGHALLGGLVDLVADFLEHGVPFAVAVVLDTASGGLGATEPRFCGRGLS
ncbi:hypothetical protein GCM10009565_43350 [Amycolatopsis albidoflavus]